MKNLSFRVLDDLLVSHFSDRAPSDSEWEAFLTAYRSLDSGREPKVLAVSTGGGPTAMQRRRLQELLGGQPKRAAFVTSSPGARSIITALAWFNPATQAFVPERMGEALDYLHVESGRRSEVRAVLDALASELDRGRREH